ncbi:hypothetical protein ACSVC9_09335 [Clostridium sp. LBM24168]
MRKKIIDIIDRINCNSMIYIFGAGWVGRLILRILRNNGDFKICFLDNNKNLVNTFIDDIEVYNPERLKYIDKNNFIILIATFDHGKDLIDQLKNYGFIENQNFYNLLEPLKNQMIKGLINYKKSNIYILGDSVMNIISCDDNDIRTLYNMIKCKIRYKTGMSVNGFYFPACHLGIYYIVLHYLKCFNKLPKIIILPINMGNFSSYWDINPKCENVDVFNEIYNYIKENNYTINNLYQLNIHTCYEDFLSHEEEYNNGVLIKNEVFENWWNCNTKSKSEYMERYKYISTWLYNYKLNLNNRKVVILKEILNFCSNNSVKVIAYITPINYEHCVKYVGNNFNNFYKMNVKTIKGLFKDYNNTSFADFSYDIKSIDFVHPNDTVHLNENGREILSNNIYSLLNK